MHGKHFNQGDVVETLITCADGTLISLKLDTSLPRAYSREYSVSGTKGVYQETGNILLFDNDASEDSGMGDYIGTANKYEEKYGSVLWKNITEKEISAGHGGMDTLELKAFFNAIKTDDEMPIDVYDAASWMVITALSEESIAKGGAPVSIPDFTGGQWVMREPKDVSNG